jgi:hypothetical protein
MTRASLITVVFLSGLAVGSFAQSALQQPDTNAVALAGIEKLHQKDIAATVSPPMPYAWDRVGPLRSARRPSWQRMRNSGPSIQTSRC